MIEAIIEGVKIPTELIKTKKGVISDLSNLLDFIHFLLGLDSIIDVIAIRR